MKATRITLTILLTVLVIATIYMHFERTNPKTSSFDQSKEDAAPKPTPSYVDQQIANMSLREKVAGLLILHTPGTDSKTLETFLDTYQPGGIIFMGDNIPSSLSSLKSLTAKLQSNSELPYLFAVDEEGGLVKRITEDTYPAAPELKNLPVSETSTAFRNRTALLQQVGLNLNFGIVADVTDNRNSFIYPRSFGGDPTAVSERVAAAVRATTPGTISTLKHFPGHGETTENSHFAIPVTTVSEATWQNRDALPFQAGIDAGADVVMFGHLTYSSVDNLPASLSAKWHSILRDQLGFKGITITDDMIMLQQSGQSRYSNIVQNSVDALNAGNTMLLVVSDHDSAESNIDITKLIDGVTDAVKSGKVSESVIDQDVRAVISLRHSLAEQK